MADLPKLTPKQRCKALVEEFDKIIVQFLADSSWLQKADGDLMDSIQKWQKQARKRLEKMRDDQL